MSSGSIFEGCIHISICKIYNFKVCLSVILFSDLFVTLFVSCRFQRKTIFWTFYNVFDQSRASQLVNHTIPSSFCLCHFLSLLKVFYFNYFSFVHLIAFNSFKSVRQTLFALSLSRGVSSLVSIKHPSNEIHYLWFMYSFTPGLGLHDWHQNFFANRTEPWQRRRRNRDSSVFSLSLVCIYFKTLICLRLNLTTWLL